MVVKRTFDLLENMSEKYADKEDILAQKKNGCWKKWSVKEYINISHQLAYGLLAEGLQEGDNVMTIMNNRPAWNFVDMALPMIKMVHIPVYPILSLEDYKHIINHSEAKAIIIGNPTIYNRIKPLLDDIGNNVKLYAVDEIEGVTPFKTLIDRGKEEQEKYKPIVENIKKSVSPDDVATIIYTSGTTGLPKGVMLSHQNLVFNFIGHANQQIKNSSHRMLSFLPLCHIYERTMNYEYQYLGISTYYAENIGTIANDLKDIHADGFCAVPRVLEMIYDKLQAAGKDLSGIKKIIYEWAFHLAERFDYKNTNTLYKLNYRIADKLVYSKWRENLGGHEMLVVSGGSSIQEKIIRLFTAAKFYVFEGYGLTETAPVIAVNNPKEMAIKIGTVGRIMEGIEVKLAEDGEILTKGVCLMKGYYKDPEYTAKVIDEDGWFHTGDIGEFVDNEYLKITDRKKEIFKLSGGKYIAPQLIENKFKSSSFIENLIVIGENEKYASAVIIPNFNYLHFWASKHKIHYRNNNELIENPKIIKRIQTEINKINDTLAPHEQLKCVRLVNDDWSVQSGELSPTLKLKRSVLYKKYDTIMRSIYGYDQQ